MLVKPAPDRAIRDPATMQLVTKEGLEVDETAPFWARALADRDLVEIKPKPDQSGSAASSKTEGSV